MAKKNQKQKQLKTSMPKFAKKVLITKELFVQNNFTKEEMIKFILVLLVLFIFCSGLYLFGYVIFHLLLDWYRKWRDNDGKF